MKRVFKFPLQWAGEVEIPCFAGITHFDRDYNDEWCVWAVCANGLPAHTFKYEITATGESVADNHSFVATVVLPTKTVWHLWEIDSE